MDKETFTVVFFNQDDVELTIYTHQKKLRKLCLRGYDKISKTFKDF